MCFPNWYKLWSILANNWNKNNYNNQHNKIKIIKKIQKIKLIIKVKWQLIILHYFGTFIKITIKIVYKNALTIQ